MCVCARVYVCRHRLMCAAGDLAVAGETRLCSEVSSGDVPQPVVYTDDCRKLSHTANCILMLFKRAVIIKTRHGFAFLSLLLSHWLFFCEGDKSCAALSMTSLKGLLRTGSGFNQLMTLWESSYRSPVSKPSAKQGR